jgi:hypothetical protein
MVATRRLRTEAPGFRHVFSGNRRHIWRGVSSDTLSNNPEKNEKKLDKAVDKMLEHFPPHEKG